MRATFPFSQGQASCTSRTSPGSAEAFWSRRMALKRQAPQLPRATLAVLSLGKENEPPTPLPAAWWLFWSQRMALMRHHNPHRATSAFPQAKEKVHLPPLSRQSGGCFGTGGWPSRAPEQLGAPTSAFHFPDKGKSAALGRAAEVWGVCEADEWPSCGTTTAPRPSHGVCLRKK